jgi:hypothetical protein
MGTKSTTRYGVFPFLGIALLIMAESGCVNQTTQSQFLFWWNWWLHLAVAVGTIGAVLVALFGQAFRAKFFPRNSHCDLRIQVGKPYKNRPGKRDITT